MDEFKYGIVLFEAAEEVDTATVSTTTRTDVFHDSQTPAVPVQLPAESRARMVVAGRVGVFSAARLSTSRVKVVIEGNVCTWVGDAVVSHGRCDVVVAMLLSTDPSTGPS